MTQGAACPSCGRPLTDGPEGLCPACLLREGLETIVQQGSGSGAAAFVDPRAPSAALLTPELANRYTGLQEAERGGMGRVMLVRDAQLGREVALKELLPAAGRSSSADAADPLATRFLREARITAQLQHPAITPVYELGRRGDGTLYYTMKFARGKTLSRAIAEAGSFEARVRLLPHFVDLCQAIGYAHSRGVLHRDIKPGNVIVGEYGETVLVDWGLAKVRGQESEPLAGAGAAEAVDSPDATQQGNILGTPAYMSPEQARGLIDRVDERSDIYSLGAVLYEILTGRTPYSGSSGAAVVSSVIAAPPPAPRDVDRNVPEAYAMLCTKAMARQPAARPASAQMLATEVESLRREPRKGSLRKILERAAVVAVLAVPLGVVLANWRSQAALESTLERMAVKGIDVKFGRPVDFVVTPVPASTEPAGPTAPTSALGALYALPWRFPDIANKDSRLWRSLQDLEPARLRTDGAPTADEARRMRELVAANQPLLDVLQETARLPRGDPRAILKQASAGRSPLAWEIPDFVALRGGALLLSHKATLDDLDGQPGQAFATLTEVLQLSNHYVEMPALVSVLRQHVLAELALGGFERMQDRLAGRPDPREFDAALAALALRPHLLRGFETELKLSLWAFEMLKRRAPSEGNEGFSESALSLSNLGWTIYGSRPLRFWINSDELLYLQFMTDAIQAIGRPYWEARAELDRIDADSARALGRLQPVTSTLLVRAKPSAQRAATVESRVIRARLRIALNRYHAGHGAYPESLEALRADGFAEIPRDPVTGEIIGYRLSPTGYWLAPASTIAKDE